MTRSGWPVSVREGSIPRSFLGAAGSCLRVALTWTLAGGIACGGLMIGALTMTGVINPGLHLLAAPVLFVAGTALGFVHGSVLAIVGRPAALSRFQALGRGAIGGLLALPLLLPGWVVTAGIGLTAALVVEMRAGVLFLCAGAWLIGTAACAWAGVEGVWALRRALLRWRERRLGSLLTAGILVATSALFLAHPPRIVGTGLRLTGVGALGLAASLTLWVGLPLVVVTLHLAHDWLVDHSPGREGPS